MAATDSGTVLRPRRAWLEGGLATLVCLLAWQAAPAAGPEPVDCGSWATDRGPFDYNNPAQRANEIALVEKYHWDANVEELKRGRSSVYVMDDLDFILRYVPNHHRALNALARYELSGGSTLGYYPADCYFKRALQFKPEDGETYLVLGIYEYHKKDFAESRDAYERAITLLPNSPEPHYNLALLYLAMNDLAHARQEAATAYRLGYPLPGLKRKLQAAGAWTAEDEAKSRPQ